MNKHCPFCDGSPEIRIGPLPRKNKFAISCVDCKAITNLFTTLTKAFAAWNKRVP